MKARRCPLSLLLVGITLLTLLPPAGTTQGWTQPAGKTAVFLAAGGHRQHRQGHPQSHHPAPSPTPPETSGSNLKPGEWEAFVDPERQIFPSLLLASATLQGSLRDDEENEAATGNHLDKDKDKGSKQKVSLPAEKEEPAVLGEPNGLIGVTICNPAAGTHVEVEVRANPYMEASSFAADLPKAGKEYHLLPKINYRYDVLNTVHQSRPVNVVCALKINGQDAGQNIVTARVRPINDCPFAYQNPDDESDYQNISWMFAAYVNEDDPAIAGLLKEAQETGVVDGFDSYQSGDPGQVLLQVFAVWCALQKHGIKYSDIGTTAADSDSLYSMHVRFIEDSLSETHANCVDASVLLASVLRRMGIEPFLLIEPDHMFLGIYLDPDGKTFACLETTALGDPDPKKFKANRYLAKTASAEVKKMKGWACFNDALDSGDREYRRNKKKFGAEDEPRYSIVDIEAARHEGIAPIAYLKGE